MPLQHQLKNCLGSDRLPSNSMKVVVMDLVRTMRVNKIWSRLKRSAFFASSGSRPRQRLTLKRNFKKTTARFNITTLARRISYENLTISFAKRLHQKGLNLTYLTSIQAKVLPLILNLSKQLRLNYPKMFQTRQLGMASLTYLMMRAKSLLTLIALHTCKHRKNSTTILLARIAENRPA